MPPSSALSIPKHMKATLEGWTVGILIADGSSPTAVETIRQARGGRRGLIGTLGRDLLIDLRQKFGDALQRTATGHRISDVLDF